MIHLCLGCFIWAGFTLSFMLSCERLRLAKSSDVATTPFLYGALVVWASLLALAFVHDGAVFDPLG